MQHTLKHILKLTFTLMLLLALAAAIPPVRADDHPTLPELSWEPAKSGLLIRLHTESPEIEAWIITIRYRLAGEMIVREHRRAVLRNMEPRTTTDFIVPTSGPAYVVEARWRKVAVTLDGEAFAQW